MSCCKQAPAIAARRLIGRLHSLSARVCLVAVTICYGRPRSTVQGLVHNAHSPKCHMLLSKPGTADRRPRAQSCNRALPGAGGRPREGVWGPAANADAGAARGADGAPLAAGGAAAAAVDAGGAAQQAPLLLLCGAVLQAHCSAAATGQLCLSSSAAAECMTCLVTRLMAGSCTAAQVATYTWADATL